MTITISTKDSIYLGVLLLLLIALGISVFAFRGRGNESGDRRQEATLNNPRLPDSMIELNKFPTNIPSTGQPHPSCFMKVYYLSPRSTVFNGSNPWSNFFIGGSTSGTPISTLQDINGDNLPDYVYAYNQTGVGSTLISSEHVGCVYLNNGNGWTKAYECFASTQTNIQSGNVTEQSYAGDCAGPPAGRE